MKTNYIERRLSQYFKNPMCIWGSRSNTNTDYNSKVEMSDSPPQPGPHLSRRARQPGLVPRLGGACELCWGSRAAIRG